MPSVLQLWDAMVSTLPPEPAAREIDHVELNMRGNVDFLQRVAQPTAKAVRITGNAVVHLPGMKTKQVKMDPELARAMKNQLRAFKKKFGREPGPNDSVFFDPDVDTPQPIPIEKLRATVIEAAKKAGLDPDRVLRTFGFDE